MKYLIKQEVMEGSGQTVFNAYEEKTGKFIACSTITVDQCEENLRNIIAKRAKARTMRTVEI